MNIKVHIVHRFYANTDDVFVIQSVDEERFRVLHYDNGIAVWSEPIVSHLSYPDLKPTYIMPRDVGRLLLEELTANGVKTPEQSKVQGLYEAQSKHLLDLQKLVFGGKS